MKFSQRVRNLEFSSTIMLSDKVRDLRASGEKIIELGGGQPSFSTVTVAKLEAAKALLDNKIYYSHSRGLYELRDLLVKKYNKKYKTSISPEKNILITPGCKQAIFYLLASIIDNKDEVLIPVPSWGSYSEIVKLVGGTPVFVECDKNRDFEISVDLIEQALTENTKVIILNSPNNPTGNILKRDTLEKLNNICLEKNIILLCDEVYKEIVFDELKYTSIASINSEFKNVVLIDGFSKSYSMTGWRLGYVIAQPELIDSMLKVQQNTATCPNTFAQHGALKALSDDGDIFIERSLSLYKQNRDFLITELNKMNNFDFILPQGSFYMFINISKIMNDSMLFSIDLLKRCKISVVPGIAFGQNAKAYIRICLATSRQNLALFIERLKDNY